MGPVSLYGAGSERLVLAPTPEFGENRPTNAVRVPLAAAFALSAAALACNLPGTDSQPPPTPTEMTLDAALQIEPEDARPEVLRLMGEPDAFTLEWQELEGQLVRWEEWSYFDQQTRFDFLDGELLWTIDIPAAPDGSLFAHFYDPLEFTDGMTLEAVHILLSDQILEQAPLDEVEIPGGLVLIGDQILLGFDNGNLVSVQTLALAPDATIPPRPLSTQGPTVPPATATVIAPPNALLVDDFEAAGQATALFGPQYMEFSYVDGEGALTARTPGVLPVMYPESLPADIVVEVDIRSPSTAPGSAYGIVFRSDDAAGGLAHYYHLVLRPADGQISLDAWKGGAWVLAESAALPPGLATPTGTNALRLEAEGSEFRAWVNGTLVLTVQDAQIPTAGVLGLSIVNSEFPETVYFDNLEVTAP